MCSMSIYKSVYVDACFCNLQFHVQPFSSCITFHLLNAPLESVFRL